MMVRVADIDGDGKISCDEMVKMYAMTRYSKNLGTPVHCIDHPLYNTY